MNTTNQVRVEPGTHTSDPSALTDVHIFKNDKSEQNTSLYEVRGVEGNAEQWNTTLNLHRGSTWEWRKGRTKNCVFNWDDCTQNQ